jgi:Ca2+-binding RTX toxin-like protein
MLIDLNDPILGLNNFEDIFIGESDYSMLMGDDVVYGPKSGVSIVGRLVDGDDYLEIYDGLRNNMNTNMGEDSIYLYGGAGSVRGGKNNDYFQITGGQWEEANGNKGNDFIINYARFAGNIRGGADDDTLVNAGGGGYFYGDRGVDTFKPFAVDNNGNITDIMFIMDFEVGIDSLDLTALSNYEFVNLDSGTVITSLMPNGTEVLVASLEGVYF